MCHVPGEEEDRSLLEGHGWRVLDSTVAFRTPETYQRYIQRSRGELGCVKPAYVLLRFSTVDEAAAALDEVAAHYERHCRAAREIAEACFSATGVVTRLPGQALG